MATATGTAAAIIGLVVRVLAYAPTAPFAIVELGGRHIVGTLTRPAIGATIRAIRRIRPPAWSTREGRRDAPFPIVSARCPVPEVQ
jgi:hypothetical protein